jgi:hypothetical protein
MAMCIHGIKNADMADIAGENGGYAYFAFVYFHGYPAAPF